MCASTLLGIGPQLANAQNGIALGNGAGCVPADLRWYARRHDPARVLNEGAAQVVERQVGHARALQGLGVGVTGVSVLPGFAVGGKHVGPHPGQRGQ